MAKYLLDTNICVFLMRGKHCLDRKIREVGIENCCISEITFVELIYGAECSNNPVEVHKIVENFCSDIEIVPMSNSIYEFARQKAILRKEGNLIDDFDLLIASCAIANDMVLVTDNTKHFDRISSVKLQNWVPR
ncbi:MAG: type II toxin-antitoxin system VapC family toxin [Lachnospiraceae bacterium]|nr:type II toxin-antitoxin system VapC family toxin [Lachnospiraceae bacterium]